MGSCWRSIATLFAMMFASQLALTIYLPAVPVMAQELGLSLGQVQLVIPAYLIAFAMMQLVAGPLSDAFGRRPVILSGLALFLLASLACALSNDIWQLLAMRFVQAAGACTTIVVGRAIIRDTSEGKVRPGRCPIWPWPWVSARPLHRSSAACCSTLSTGARHSLPQRP